MDQEEDKTIYHAVMNHEEQYSIWPAHKPMPAGWREAGKTGLKSECLAFIEEVWTDMRPLSLRRKMEQDAKVSQVEG
ncbi:MbtH family NRPS accessory protein [Pendulispora brunnea]|uniref:MbtH family NRPS accessory protein n=1 Tax=Pendulispora brunnea TaxID=2905690 RepID=A0ABZ2KR35_9BACT